ncbi:hypothetical protein G7074_15985 [Pedobacter sp. HDW13]|uniref:hypothetical protein n=1 Tax=Pedobacter sp. HDW13 TaxID=2714940 RepID=UPI001408E3B0|nr:hypothetical protein [Pedobacter sp. HDW13]QIL40631.1 hypothetical protein G7074_15985 [Pedobacter sp. HDW13]
MKNAVSIFCLALLSLFGLETRAQGTYSGCLVSSQERVYTYDGGGSVYDPGSFIDLSPNYCSWTPTSGTVCNICNGSLNGGGNCPGHNYQAQGVEGFFTMLACPIDDYLLPLILTLAGLGGFFVRKRTLLSV